MKKLFHFDEHIGDWRVLVQTHDIQDGAITTRCIGDEAVRTEKIADEAVTTPKIADGAVTGEKVPDNTFGLEKFDPEFMVTERMIKDQAVTTDKIADGAVTEQKIAPEAVTEPKIKDENVLERHLAPGAVTTEKLAPGMIEKLETLTDAEPTPGSVKPLRSGGAANVYGHYVENPEFLRVITDRNKRMLEATRLNANKVLYAGLEVGEGIEAGGDIEAGGSISAGGDLNVGGDQIVMGRQVINGVTYEVVNSPEWIAVWLDGEGKVLAGFKKDGRTFIGDADFLDAIKANKEAIETLENQLALLHEGIDWDALKAVRYIDNPEFLRVYTDAAGRLLWGIKKNADIYYGAGVPSAIKDYINNLISKAYETYDFSYDFIKAVTDKAGHFLYGVNSDGHFVFGDFPPQIIDKIKQIIGYYVEESSHKEYIYAMTDGKGRVLLSVTKDGKVHGDFDLSKSIGLDIEKYIGNQDIYSRNLERLSILYNACQYEKANNKSKNLQLCVVTDTHGEIAALSNAVTAVSKFPTIDCLIHCGDITSDYYNITQVTSNMTRLLECTKDVFFVIGNHDVGNTMYPYWACSHETAFEAFISPLISKGILRSGEYLNGKCYYYHDFNEQKVRLIVLYEFDAPLDIADNEYWEEVPYNSSYSKMEPGTTYYFNEQEETILNCGDYTGGSFKLKRNCTTPNTQYSNEETMPKYKIGRAVSYIGKEQALWFLNTLYSVPDGYGVVVATHNPFSRKCTNQANYKFAVNNANWTGENQGQYCSHSDLIAEAVDAWIKKDYFSFKYVGDTGWGGSDARYLNTQEGQEGSYAYAVNKDFSTRAENAYFACFIGGHCHKDLIMKHDIYSKQVGVHPICGITKREYNINNDVCRPHIDNQAYDALTIVSVANTGIALCRIGNDWTIDGEKRDFEIINV